MEYYLEHETLTLPQSESQIRSFFFFSKLFGMSFCNSAYFKAIGCKITSSHCYPIGSINKT